MHTLALYCACGATLTGRIEPNLPAEGIVAIWMEAHGGPECGRTDARGARNARRRQERDQRKNRKIG